MLFARVVATEPDPLSIARALVDAGWPGLALLHAGHAGHSGDGGDAGGGLGETGRWSFVAAAPVARSARMDPLEDDAGFVAEGSALAFAPRWIGAIPYEGRRAGLERAGWSPSETRAAPALVAPAFHRYEAVVCVDHREGRVLVVGSDLGAVERLAAAVRAARAARATDEGELLVEVTEDEPPGRHAARVAAARELIARGDLYQVNLARRLGVIVREGDALGLYRALSRRAPTPFGACLWLDDGVRVASTSPELLLRARAREGSPTAGFGALLTAPIKGTRPRGLTAESDRALACELDADPKERAELTMIVDVERNDLGRVAEVGSVRVAWGPRVVTHRTVHHRAALLTARARGGVTRREVLEAMVPSGSVTGAPKVRAMEVIAALEPARRGLYTGGIGFVAHDGGVVLSMAIRTAVLSGREGEYLTGGGIVADSDPAREVEETRWKALQLLGAARRP